VSGTDQESRLAALGRDILRKASAVLWKAFSKIVLEGRKPDTAKTKPIVERTEPVTLENGNTVTGIVRDKVLVLVSVKDKTGNVIEMEPRFFNTSLLKLKNEIYVPGFD
jgi:hypothetical protein